MAQYSNDYYIGDKYHQATYYCQLNINRKCNFKDLMKRYYMQFDDNIKAVSNIEMIDFNMEKISRNVIMELLKTDYFYTYQ